MCQNIDDIFVYGTLDKEDFSILSLIFCNFLAENLRKFFLCIRHSPLDYYLEGRIFHTLKTKYHTLLKAEYYMKWV